MIDNSSDKGSDENSDEKFDEIDEKPDDISAEISDEGSYEGSEEEIDEKPEPKPEEHSKQRSEENIVFVGKKPTMNYVLAVVTQFNSGSPEIVIKARGRSISRAVDVAEIVRHRFVSTSMVKDITIDTEPMDTEEGETINVSSIEITLESGQ